MLLIREYCPADETDWLRCRAVAFLDTAYYDNVAPAKPVYRGAVADLVAIVDGCLVGIMDVEFEGQPGELCVGEGGLGGMIGDVAVHPDYRRQGIAHALLQEAKCRAEGRRVVRLQAWTRDDVAARAWYAAEGFVHVQSYLHVFLSPTQARETLSTPVPGLTVVGAFAHYTGHEPDKIRDTYPRVHECVCYELCLG